MKLEPIYAKLGSRIRLVRETLGWSQADLAGKVGLTRTSVCNIESGRQRVLLHDVVSFADAFGMSPKVLTFDIW